MTYRSVQSHHNLWVGDTILAKPCVLPCTVEQILVDDEGTVYLTLRDASGHPYARDAGDFYRNAWYQGDAWTSDSGDKITILTKRSGGLQETLFEALT